MGTGASGLGGSDKNLSKLSERIFCSNTTEELANIIKELRLPVDKAESANSLLTQNFTLFTQMKAAVATVVSLRLDDRKQCLRKLKELTALHVSEPDKHIIGEFLSKVSFGKVSVDKYRMIINEAGLKCYDPERIQENESISDESKLILKEIRKLWLNFSGWSSEFADDLATVGVLPELVKNIRSLVGTKEVKTRFSQSVETDFGIIFYIAKLRKQPKAVRQSGVVDVSESLVKIGDGSFLTLMAVVTLALITDKIETSLLSSCESVVDLLMMSTEFAIAKKDSKISAEDLLIALRELCRNGDIRKELVTEKRFEIILSALSSQTLPVVEAALKLLVVIASDKDNQRNTKCFAIVKKKVEELGSTGDVSIVPDAKRVMWQIKEDTPKAEGSTNEKKDANKNQIMISYNRQHKKLVQKIYKALTDRNYKTWIDEKDMSGSTLDSMSEAIEDAAAVLVCMSPAYKTSKFCKLEAEYAYLREVPVMFLQMERDYKPDGWLGILLGDKLFYDFSGKYDFDSKLIQMMKELDKTLGLKAPQTKPTTTNPSETLGESETVQQTRTVNGTQATTQQTDNANKVEAVQESVTVKKMEVVKQTDHGGTSGQSKHMQQTTQTEVTAHTSKHGETLHVATPVISAIPDTVQVVPKVTTVEIANKQQTTQTEVAVHTSKHGETLHVATPVISAIPDTVQVVPKVTTVEIANKKPDTTVSLRSRPSTAGIKRRDKDIMSVYIPYLGDEQRRFLSEITPISSDYHYKFVMSGKVTKQSLKLKDSVEISLDGEPRSRDQTQYLDRYAQRRTPHSSYLRKRKSRSNTSL